MYVYCKYPNLGLNLKSCELMSARLLCAVMVLPAIQHCISCFCSDEMINKLGDIVVLSISPAMHPNS